MFERFRRDEDPEAPGDSVVATAERPVAPVAPVSGALRRATDPGAQPGV